MKPFAEMTKEELLDLRKQLHIQYKEFQGKDLRLDMSRGKPSTEQLDLSMGMMDVLSSKDDLTCDDGKMCIRDRSVKMNGAVHTIRDMGEVAFVILRKAEDVYKRQAHCRKCSRCRWFPPARPNLRQTWYQAGRHGRVRGKWICALHSQY